MASAHLASIFVASASSLLIVFLRALPETFRRAAYVGLAITITIAGVVVMLTRTDLIP